MSEQRPEIELDRSEYTRAFDRPLASPKHLRLAVAGFLAIAVFLVSVSLWLDIWWMAYAAIPAGMWAGGSLAGLWPNWFFGNDPSKDDFT